MELLDFKNFAPKEKPPASYMDYLATEMWKYYNKRHGYMMFKALIIQRGFEWAESQISQANTYLRERGEKYPIAFIKKKVD